MIGFEITINNQEPVIATSHDVMYVMINCNYPFGDSIYVEGMDTLSKLVWVDENLRIGDKVVIKVVEISNVSPVMKIDCSRNEMKAKYEQLEIELKEKELI